MITEDERKIRLTDPELHKRASAASRQRAVEMFDQESGVDRYIDLYRRVIESS